MCSYIKILAQFFLSSGNMSNLKTLPTTICWPRDDVVSNISLGGDSVCGDKVAIPRSTIKAKVETVRLCLALGLAT